GFPIHVAAVLAADLMPEVADQHLAAPARPTPKPARLWQAQRANGHVHPPRGARTIRPRASLRVPRPLAQQALRIARPQFRARLLVPEADWRNVLAVAATLLVGWRAAAGAYAVDSANH